jgi:hypothetical protein
MPIRLPFGLVIHRASHLAGAINRDLAEWYERGVIHAESHDGVLICDCRNRDHRVSRLVINELTQRAYDR